MNKATFLQSELFQDYKMLFNEDNIIIILDEYSKTDCIFGNTHISLISNNSEEENDKINIKDQQNYIDNFTAFYNIFLNEHDIIKLVNEKKIRKYNKIDLIYNKKILQIKNGHIQLKKIFMEKKDNNNKNDNNSEQNNDKNNNLNIINGNSNNNKIIIDNMDIDVKVQPTENKIQNNNFIKNDVKKENIIKNSNTKKTKIYMEHNIFKIKELFEYQNSYPLFSIILLDESEISNLSFLLYTFNEIFMAKIKQPVSKLSFSKSILKFFKRFKYSKFTPIFFNEKYFKYFLNFFDNIIKKIKLEKQLFSDIVFFPLINNFNENDTIKYLNNNKDIFNNLFERIHIFKINSIKHENLSKTSFGKLFKFNRVENTMEEFGSNIKPIITNENRILLYNVKDDLMKGIIKKNRKKSNLEDLIKEGSYVNVNNISKCGIY